MRKASILVLALLMIVGALTLAYLEKSAAQAQQQPAATDTKKSPAAAKSKDFPQGTATPSAECGECHQAIYREYAFGFGSDITYKPMAYKDPEARITLSSGKSIDCRIGTLVCGDRSLAHARAAM